MNDSRTDSSEEYEWLLKALIDCRAKGLDEDRLLEEMDVAWWRMTAEARRRFEARSKEESA